MVEGMPPKESREGEAKWEVTSPDGNTERFGSYEEMVKYIESVRER